MLLRDCVFNGPAWKCCHPTEFPILEVRRMKSFYSIDKVSSQSHLLSNSLVYHDLTGSPEVGWWEMLPLNSIFKSAC